MPLYRYKAVNGAGATVQGEYDAMQENAVVEWLRESALMPLKVELAKGGRSTASAAATGAAPARRSWFARKKVSQEQLLSLTRELATLLKAGLPLDRALEILINLSNVDSARSLMQQIRDDVRGGASLSQALDKSSGVFSRFYINIVRAGEAGGALAAVMARLSEFMERAKELRETIRSALIYPALLLIVAVSSIMLLLIKVVPQFEQIFQSFGAELPVFTQMVVNLSKAVQAYWFVFVIAVLAAITGFGYAYNRSLQMRNAIDRLSLKVPVIGNILNKSAVARFARTLSTTFAAGVPLVDALTSVAGATGNVVYSDATLRVRDDVSGGQQLNFAMRNTGVFPNMVVQMTSIGEESGALDDMLDKAASYYEEQVDNAVDALTSLLEPIIMAVLGVVIGGLIIAMYLPIFQLGQVVGGGK